MSEGITHSGGKEKDRPSHFGVSTSSKMTQGLSMGQPTRSATETLQDPGVVVTTVLYSYEKGTSVEISRSPLLAR